MRAVYLCTGDVDVYFRSCKVDGVYPEERRGQVKMNLFELRGRKKGKSFRQMDRLDVGSSCDVIVHLFWVLRPIFKIAVILLSSRPLLLIFLSAIVPSKQKTPSHAHSW